MLHAQASVDWGFSRKCFKVVVVNHDIIAGAATGLYCLEPRYGGHCSVVIINKSSLFSANLPSGQELNPPIQQVGAIDNGYGYDYQHQQSWIPPNDYQYWPNSNGYQGPPPEIPLDVALAQQQQFGPWPPYPEGGGHVQEVPLEQAQWMVQQGQEPIMQDNLNLDWNQVPPFHHHGSVVLCMCTLAEW